MSDNGTAPAPEEWTPPTEDAEFVFEGLDTLPGWADKNWASYSAGPALAVPAGDIYGAPPYHTKTARIGDTVKFVANKGSMPAHFEVIAGEPDPETAGTRKPPQVTNAALEDLLKLGYLGPDELGPDAKAQVLGRSPELKRMIEDGIGVPEAQEVGALVKVA